MKSTEELSRIAHRCASEADLSCAPEEQRRVEEAIKRGIQAAHEAHPAEAARDFLTKLYGEPESLMPEDRKKFHRDLGLLVDFAQAQQVQEAQ